MKGKNKLLTGFRISYQDDVTVMEGELLRAHNLLWK